MAQLRNKLTVFLSHKRAIVSCGPKRRCVRSDFNDCACTCADEAMTMVGVWALCLHDVCSSGKYGVSGCKVSVTAAEPRSANLYVCMLTVRHSSQYSIFNLMRAVIVSVRSWNETENYWDRRRRRRRQHSRFNGQRKQSHSIEMRPVTVVTSRLHHIRIYFYRLCTATIGTQWHREWWPGGSRTSGLWREQLPQIHLERHLNATSMHWMEFFQLYFLCTAKIVKFTTEHIYIEWRRVRQSWSIDFVWYASGMSCADTAINCNRCPMHALIDHTHGMPFDT